jgi:spermidine synthase
MSTDTAIASPVLPARGWRRAIFGLFCVSGISGLLYEVAWTRMLHLLFGDTVLATSTVLTAFMAGLALGSWCSGRRIDRRPQALGIYAGLELGIGLSALLLPLALEAITPLYVWLHRQFHTTFVLLSLVRFCLAFALLLVPTTLMGATLPVLSRYIVRTSAILGWSVGVLYALNTGGAVLGCFAAGYVLVGSLGLYQTVALGAVLNLGIALVVWSGRHWAGDELLAEALPAAAPVPQSQGVPVYSTREVVLVLWGFALSGFTALAYEVIWTRALTFFIGNSTYAFSAMLTTFLCGLALGSLIFARVSDWLRHLLPLLGLLQVGIGVYGLLTIAIFAYLFYGLDTWWEGFSSAYWGTPVWLTFVKTFSVILPPTLAMGGMFPLVSKIVARGPQDIGRKLGEIYALNTLGGIAGAWVAGFVGLALCGVQTSLVVTALLNAGLGSVLLAYGTGRRRLRQGLVGAGVLGLCVAVTALTPRLRFADIAGEPEKEILHYEEDSNGVVKVATDIYERKLLSINGWSVAGTGTPNLDVALVNDYPEVQKMLAHLPMLLHPAPHQALVIGFGAGGTSWSMSRYNALEHLDIVEFMPGVIRAAHFFPEVNHNVLADPRLRVIIDDGRNYLLVTPQHYDVISVDTLDPKHAGNGNLYTEEFYTLSKRALKPGGIFVQWLPYHQVGNVNLKLIARTFQHVYPHATLWLNRFKGYSFLVGTLAPLRIDVALLEQRLRQPSVQGDLAEVYVATPWQFLESFTMRADTLRRYTAGEVRRNSYNHPYVEFYGMTWYDPVEENLAELAWFADDITPLLVFNGDYTPEQQQAIQQRVALQRRISRYIFRGYLANWRRQLQEGTREYRKALKLDPHDEGIKFALGIATRHKQQALAVLERQPQDIKALSKLGYIAWSEQQYDEALQRFAQVLATEPRQAAAYVHLGANYIAQERFAEATAAYLQAGRLNPEYVRLVEQSLDLIQHLQRAHEHPDDPSVSLQLGTIYASDGRSDRAVEMFEKAVALAPSLAAGWLNLGLNYEAEERDAEAMHAYRRVLLLEPDNPMAQNNYEKLALKTALARRTPTQLRLDPEHVLDVDPDHASGYYQLGLRYLRNNEPEAAAAVLEQALRLQPDHDTAAMFLGMAYTALRASSKAEAAYRRAIALAPQNAQAYNYLGLVYQQQQRYAKAVKAHQRAIDLAPDYAVAYANLAASYEALGKIKPALLAYDQALQRDASLEFVHEKITVLRKQVGR